MKAPWTLASLILSLVVALLPFYWWEYDYGGLMVIYSSPFYVSIYLLGTLLKWSYVISAALEASRILLIISLARDIYLVVRKGQVVTNWAVMSICIQYLIYPVIYYFLVSYISYSPLGIHIINYSFLEIGSEVVHMNVRGANMVSVFTYSPSTTYWFALAVGLLSIPSYLESKREKKKSGNA